MFKLLRYFSITSLIAMVVAAAVLGTFYRHMATRDLIETAEYRNVVLTQAFSNSVWPQFAPFMSEASALTGDELRARPEIARLNQAIVKQAKGLFVLKVKIFDLNAKTLFSTEAKQIGVVKDPNYVGVASARRGGVNSKLEHRDSFNSIAGIVYDRFVLSSYLPVRRGEGAPIEAVFEVYADVTPLMSEVGQRLRSVILVVIAVSALLYAVLFLIVRYADRLIKRQYAERRQAQERLRRYQRIVAASSDLIVFLDADCRYQAANAAYLQAFNMTEEQLIGKSIVDVSGEEAFETRIKLHFERCMSGKTSHYQHWFELPALGERYLDVRYDPFYDTDGTVSGVVVNIRDITERKQAEEEREALYRQLIDASRQAGKAEIATGVLHNVGNVLNSINVSATLVADKFLESKIASLTKVSALLQDHADDLGTFMVENEKGKQLPAYLSTLADHLQSEQGEIISEVQSIVENIDHIKQIVIRQQSYASDSGVSQPTVIADLLDDAVSMNVSERHAIDIVREYPDIPAAMLDKHKVLQIVVNLIRNAKQAVNEHDAHDKKITLRIRHPGSDYVYIEVSDNGVGIAPEDMSRIFEYGFTTKDEGHGFGLHVSANTAREMGGSLTCGSEGAGKGATFILELPFTPAEMVA